MASIGRQLRRRAELLNPSLGAHLVFGGWHSCVLFCFSTRGLSLPTTLLSRAPSFSRSPSLFYFPSTSARETRKHLANYRPLMGRCLLSASLHYFLDEAVQPQTFGALLADRRRKP